MARFSWSGRRRTWFAKWLMAVLLAVFGVSGTLPRLCAQQLPPPQDLSIQELVNQCAALLGSQRYVDAIPYLLAYIKVLKSSDADEARRALERALVSLGLAYLEAEDTAKAVETLEGVLNEFPQSGQRRGVLLLLTEAHAFAEDWEKVVEVGTQLTREPGLHPQELLSINQSLGEAYYTMERWAPAATALGYVFHHAPQLAMRTEAAAMGTICLVRAELYDELFRFLPEVFDTPARYDIRMTLTLLESADENFDKGRFKPALLLYRLVYSKAELAAEIDKRITETTRLRDNVTRMPGLERTRVTSMRRQLERQLQRLESEKADLAEIAEYVQGLQIRLARTYLVLQRHWEALLLFHDLYERWPDHELADAALYSAFSTAREMDHAERAIAEGRLYMEAFPNGEYWDVLTLALTHLHMQRKEWEPALAVAEKAIAVNPAHTHYDQLLYLIGFSHFQVERFAPAQQRFAELIEKFPDSYFFESAKYWHAAAHLFLAQYRPARTEFEAFLREFEHGVYYEDAYYRTGVAQYGDGDMDASLGTLQRFVGKFPNSEFAPEAHSMIGDIQASRGELDEAIASYRAAIAKAQNLIQVNYATFQIAKVLELERKYEQIILLFNEYLKEHPTDGNFTEATYWLGNAQLELGHREEAMRTFFDAIVRYGDKPENHGIDMILRDLIYEVNEAPADPVNRRISDRLYEELRRSRQQKKRTLELRLVTMFAETTTDPAQRAPLVEMLLLPSNREVAGPLTLDLMGREALAQGRKTLAREAFEYLLAHHRDSELALSALRELAEMRITDNQLDEARVLLAEIGERFATTEIAGEARKRTADVLRMQGHYDEAREMYTSILTVREWKGELWPESLFGAGLCDFESGKIEQAFAYFQRIYVLYEGYSAWAAKAYLKSGECLEKLNKRAEAIATYKEMVAHPALAVLPESNDARRAIERLGGGA